MMQRTWLIPCLIICLIGFNPARADEPEVNAEAQAEQPSETSLESFPIVQNNEPPRRRRSRANPRFAAGVAFCSMVMLAAVVGYTMREHGPARPTEEAVERVIEDRDAPTNVDPTEVPEEAELTAFNDENPRLSNDVEVVEPTDATETEPAPVDPLEQSRLSLARLSALRDNARALELRAEIGADPEVEEKTSVLDDQNLLLNPGGKLDPSAPIPKTATPQILQIDHPEIPAGLIKAGDQPKATFSVHLDAQGKIEDFSFDSGSGYPELDELLEETVRNQWKFTKTGKQEELLAIPYEFQVEVPK